MAITDKNDGYMDDSNLKRDMYVIAPSSDGNDSNSMVCSDSKGSTLFKISGDQFIDTKGKVISQTKQAQQSSTEIYDGANKLLGKIMQQRGQSTLNDASGNAIAKASTNSGSINITSPDGNSTIATVTVEGGSQQGRMGGGFGGGMGGMGGILGGMGGMGQQRGQSTPSKVTVSVQSQSISAVLLLSFAYSLSKTLGGGGRRRGIGGMMGGMAAGMLLGGLLGGGLGNMGGGSGNTPRMPRIPRIR